jgi:hypothetical protein
MAKKALRQAAIDGTMDCACVIHGNKYDWCYVERLYNMVKRHSIRPIRFHVFTESDRFVPGHMVKHVLHDWPGIAGPKKSWWYKMQMFEPGRISGRLLYFDLDTVIVDNIDWIQDLDTRYFWSIRDFRHLWRPSWKGMNSSVMLWDTTRFGWVWKEFQKNDVKTQARLFHGDQDFLNSVLTEQDLRFIDESLIKSWRWQIKDGGMDMKTRVYRRPDAGSVLLPGTSIVIFHGQPKPHEVHDAVITRFWHEQG